jgi:hypothetical protein
MPLKEYLADVLPGMSARKLFDVQALTPARWAASHV